MWAEDEALAELVPPERFTTGPAHGATKCPYAVLVRGPDRTQALPSGGARLDRLRIELHIWARSLDEAQQIAQLAAAAFDRAAFVFDGGQVLDMRPAGREQNIEPDGRCRLVLAYDALTELASTET
jgi:hypothetical protein